MTVTRQIVLDTETTGLEVTQGHRVIELAAVEIVNRRVTGSTYQRYLNPDREIDAGAREVHGIDVEFLRDKPRFQDIGREFVAFIEGAELIIHNAAFDVGFLNAELALAGMLPLAQVCPKVTDTLRMAKELHPGKRASLDALCERYAVDNSHRSVHGALLDAGLLAEVYLAMTRGQDSLMMDISHPQMPTAVEENLSAAALALPILPANEQELQAHEGVLDDIGSALKGVALWRVTPA